MMEKLYKLSILFTICFLMSSTLFSQEKKCKAEFDFGADVVSRYIWRGSDFGNTPSIQPGFSVSMGKLEIGGWGNYGLSSNTGSLEADLYAEYNFDFGLGLIVTDYYFPGEALVINGTNSIVPVRAGNYFDYENAHTFEVGLSYEIKDFTIKGFQMIDGDTYGELSYALGKVDLILGAGNGAYTVDGDFNICNAGIGYNKELKLSETYSLPLFGQFIINPSSEQVHFVFGFTF